MALKRFKVDKLIRDHLPDLLRSKGIAVHEQQLNPEKFLQSLKEKLLEEAKEVSNAHDINELAEELADVLEVLQTLAKTIGISLQQIEDKRLEKHKIKGGFDRKVYSPYMDIDDKNQHISYYLAKPQHYPEIEFLKP